MSEKKEELAEPEWECCEDWKRQADKVNAPILLAQGRNPHLTATKDFKFKAWRFCPWCGAGRGAVISSTVSPTQNEKD
jgi:hypothetical protein